MRSIRPALCPPPPPGLTPEESPPRSSRRRRNTGWNTRKQWGLLLGPRTLLRTRSSACNNTPGCMHHHHQTRMHGSRRANQGSRSTRYQPIGQTLDRPPGRRRLARPPPHQDCHSQGRGVIFLGHFCLPFGCFLFLRIKLRRPCQMEPGRAHGLKRSRAGLTVALERRGPGSRAAGPKIEGPGSRAADMRPRSRSSLMATGPAHGRLKGPIRTSGSAAPGPGRLTGSKAHELDRLTALRRP